MIIKDRQIVIRADASTSMGTGHVMRTLTLADMLTRKGAKISYISRALSGDLCGYVEARGYPVYRLTSPAAEFSAAASEEDLHRQWPNMDWVTDAEQTLSVLNAHFAHADCLIVDHYNLGRQWEARMRSIVDRIMVIDDLADREHDCDLLVDQNLHDAMEGRYERLLPKASIKLLGPAYSLLRPDFGSARNNLCMRDGRVRRILIFFGGSDPTNETSKALEALMLIGRHEIDVDVVVGGSNIHRREIEERCSKLSFATIHYQTERMAELMAAADLSIGAGGSATWERCCLGLPTLLIAVAANQIEIARHCARAGAAIYLGVSECLTAQRLGDAITSLIQDSSTLQQLERNALALTDGMGAHRVCAAVLKMLSTTQS